MTAPVIQQNSQTVKDPTLSDVLQLFKKEIMISMNCHHVGIIQSFDPAKQTAQVSIAYKKTYFQSSASGVITPELVAYPLMADVPVIVLGGGTASLTFPIKKGDECLVLFNDRDIDNWFGSGQIGPVATPRLHAITDGFALVGIRSLGNVLTNYDATHATLQNGGIGVGVSSSLVKIYNATTTLGSIMQSILTQLETLANTPASSGSPINPAVATALSSLATQLGGLLE